MDNHIHLYLHVPPVPERYRTGTVPGAPSGTVPDAPCTSAFSMRPAENRAPRWMPDITTPACTISPAGDSPSEAAIRRSLADGVPVVFLPRPPTGFTLDDGEMLDRLDRLLFATKSSVAPIRKRWAVWRATGRSDDVEREKEAYLRRMYNISQYMKTLKQRISEHVNRECGHCGQLWEGRFHSALVEHEIKAEELVTSYIEWNAPRAGITAHPKDWRWCSFATACSDGPYAVRARAAYERLFGCAWEEARTRLESIFFAKMPGDFDPAKKGVLYETRDAHGMKVRRALTSAQLIKTTLRFLEGDGFVSRRRSFAAEVLGRFHARFPAPKDRTSGLLRLIDWRRAA